MARTTGITQPLPNQKSSALTEFSFKGKGINNRIFLIGMPGAGKSYWAEVLKKQTKIQCYDLDFIIEVMEDKSIASIFSEDGEAYFRKVEAKMLRLFAEKKNFILATGGGTPCFNDNMEWMNKMGITIWIDEPIEVLKNRIMMETKERPLIKSKSESELELYLTENLEQRKKYYSKATVKFQGQEFSAKKLKEILQQYA